VLVLVLYSTIIRRPANGSERMSQRDEVDAVLVRRVLALLA
jgi:hypothetical protein